MADLASLWIGGKLGPIEIASAKSFVRHGDQLTIYATKDISNLPEGVIWKDANSIFPSDRIILHRKSQSPALHSDLFRYALMERTEQTWVDLDIIAFKSFTFDSAWVFGMESVGQVDGAVLRLPKISRALAELLKIRPDTVGIPPSLKGFRRLKYWMRSFGRGLPIDRWTWGAVGPRALTYYLKQFEEISHALPVSAFYSVPMSDTRSFLEPAHLILSRLPNNAWGVHLWGKQLRKLIEQDFGGQIPAGSFLDLATKGEI